MASKSSTVKTSTKSKTKTQSSTSKSKKNETKNNLNQAFKGEITLYFNYKKSEKGKVRKIDIPAARIQYLVLDYHFESIKVLPIVYIAMKIPLKLHDMILQSYHWSTFVLKIKRKNVLSKTSAVVDTVKDTFEYVPENTNVNESPQLSSSETEDKSYVSTTIGMVSKTMSNKLRKTFDTVYYNIDTKSLIKNVALKGIKKIIMRDVQYNTKYTEDHKLSVDPQNTRYKFLKNLFDTDPYYDAYFTFFMDFDKTVYLIPKDGKAVKANSKPSKCIINVNDVVDPVTLMPGYIIKDKAYNLYINAANHKVTVNEGSDKDLDKVRSFNYETTYQDIDVSDAKSAGDKEKAKYIREDNVAKYANEIMNSKVLVEFFKENIDSSLLTPNKEYRLNLLSNYSEYNGKYILVYKLEAYTPIGGGQFNITTSAGFKLIKAIEKAKTKKNKKKQKYNNNVDQTSSADKKSTANSRIADRKKK